MQQMLRLVIAAVRGRSRSRSFPASRSAQTAVKQVKLTDKQIEGFIAAQKDMAAVAEKMQGDCRQARSQGAGASSRASPRSTALPASHEYDDVAANISDGDGRHRSADQGVHRAEGRHPEGDRGGQGDKSIPEKEKKQMLEELNEALKTAQPIQYPSNIELVKKYCDKIDAVLQ